MEHLCIAKYSNAILSLISKLFRIQLSIAAEQKQTASEMGLEFRELRQYGQQSVLCNKGELPSLGSSL